MADAVVSLERDLIESATSQSPIPLWRNRDYMLLWMGQLVSSMGSGVSGLAQLLITTTIEGTCFVFINISMATLNSHVRLAPRPA